MEENKNTQANVEVVEKKGFVSKVREKLTLKNIAKGALILGGAVTAYALGYKNGSNSDCGSDDLEFVDSDDEE